MGSLNKINPLSFAFFFLLFSCGGNVESDPTEAETQRDPITLPIKGKNIVVKCVEAEGCPKGLIKVVSQNAVGQINSCIGSVISANRVLLNLSCLPEELRFAGADCKDRVLMAFNPGVLGEGEAVTCRSVEKIGRISGISPFAQSRNFATLRVDSLPRMNTVRVSSRGHREGERIQLWYLETRSEKSNGSSILRSSMKKMNCKNRHNTFLNPGAKSRNSRSMVLTDCEGDITADSQGNISAMAFNQRGRLLALAHAKPTASMINQIKQRFAVDSQTIPQFSQAFFGTQIKCFPPVVPYLSKDDCDKGYSESQIIRMKSYYVRNNIDKDRFCGSIKTALQAYENETGKLRFSARLKFSDDRWEQRKKFIYIRCPGVLLETRKITEAFQSTIQPIPKCFLNFDDWIEEYRTLTRVVLGRRYYRWDSPAEIIYDEASHYGIELGLSREFQLELKTPEKSPEEFSVKFSPRDLHRQDRSDLLITRIGPSEERLTRVGHCQ